MKVITILNILCGPQPMGSVRCGCSGQIHTYYRNPVEKRDGHGHCVSEREGERAREPGPLPGPAFIASLGTLCGG